MTSDQPLEGRCGAKCRDGGYCESYPVQGRDRCRMHGGTQRTGLDNPNAVHGLRSDYLSEEDREIYEQVRQHDEVELLREEFWMVKTKLLRAARATEGNEGVGMARDLLDKIEDGEADDEVVDALANLLRTSNTAVDRAIGRLIDLAKEIRKHEDGERVTVEHSGQIDGERTLGDDEKAAIRQAIDPGT